MLVLQCAVMFKLHLRTKVQTFKDPFQKWPESWVFPAAEWSSWLMRKSAASAWMEKQTSSCPAPTASVRSALINGEVLGQVRFDCTHPGAPLFIVFLFPQERAESKLSDLSPAGHYCQRVVGVVWFPHRRRHGGIHPEPGRRCWLPSQALTHTYWSHISMKST